jgi:hypothetical protein
VAAIAQRRWLGRIVAIAALSIEDPAAAPLLLGPASPLVVCWATFR